jgi:hypothetical protein
VTEKSNYKYYVLAMLLATYTISFIDRQILAILSEAIKADLQLSDTQVGLLTGFTFALFYTVFGIPWPGWRTARTASASSPCPAPSGACSPPCAASPATSGSWRWLASGWASARREDRRRRSRSCPTTSNPSNARSRWRSSPSGARSG